MGRAGDSGGRRRLIGPEAKAAFIAALRRGARRDEAAAAAGFSLAGLYDARQRDPGFEAEWVKALAVSATMDRPPADAAAGETRIVPTRCRVQQSRKMRNVRFDQDRRFLFLQHFATSCDLRAAAAEACVSEATVHYHRRTDPIFAELFQQTLDQAYGALEAELLRQRLAAQEKLRAALDADPAAGAPTGDEAAEFERGLKLLARWDRKARRPERHAAAGSRRQVWTFDTAIALLEERLKALGVPIEPLSPEEAALWDGEGADAGGDSGNAS